MEGLIMVDRSLSSEAQMYIQSLVSAHGREAAREYAHMDNDAFRARIGPAVDSIADSLRLISKRDMQWRREVRIGAAFGAGAVGGLGLVAKILGLL